MVIIMENEWTRIRVRKSTTEKLKRLGNKGETYDDIINRLVEAYTSTGPRPV